MLLRSITKHVKDQNWFAVALDFFIVVVGILIAFQITEWNEARQQGKLEQSYLVRLASDLEENIEYLKSQRENSIEIMSTIENALAVLNAENSGDRMLVDAVGLYITYGTELQDFKINRSTYDDLNSSGNLETLKNKDLVQCLGQLHTSFADHNLDALVNTDWIVPFESKITYDFDFMRFDRRTQKLFPEKTDAEIVVHIRDNYDLIQRHAALHYWYVEEISNDYKSAATEARSVLDMIRAELGAR